MMTDHNQARGGRVGVAAATAWRRASMAARGPLAAVVVATWASIADSWALRKN